MIQFKQLKNDLLLEIFSFAVCCSYNVSITYHYLVKSKNDYLKIAV